MKDLVFEHKGGFVTSSLLVTEMFEKRHANVLRALQNLDCSASFTELNYELSSYRDSSGRSNPIYYMTKDGFIFLVMGFKGEKAAYFKELFIKAFNNKLGGNNVISVANQLLAQAQLLVSMESKIESIDSRLTKLESLENGLNYISIKGFGRQSCKVINRREAIRLGKTATKYCKENNIPISTVEDERYGYVNTYPKQVLARLY
jgi:Rha family phage regulatory protein